MLFSPDFDLETNEFYDELFNAFGQLDEDKKEQFLTLSNIYPTLEDDNQNAEEFKTIVKKFLSENPECLYSFSEALNIVEITVTNTFHNGICLVTSRFNHSCVSNAEYFWNYDIGRRDTRAIRKIKKGEEITVNYGSCIIKDGVIKRDDRRRKLSENHCFLCSCDGCNLTSEELQLQNNLCDEFIQLQAKTKEIKLEKAKTNSSDTADELLCLKKLYKLAKELKIMRKNEILTFFLEEAFDAACQGYITMEGILREPLECENSGRFASLVEGKKKSFWKDIVMCAEAGLKFSSIIYGIEFSKREEWNQRKENPLEFFRRENGFDPLD